MATGVTTLRLPDRCRRAPPPPPPAPASPSCSHTTSGSSGGSTGTHCSHTTSGSSAAASAYGDSCSHTTSGGGGGGGGGTCSHTSSGSSVTTHGGGGARGRAARRAAAVPVDCTADAANRLCSEMILGFRQSLGDVGSDGGCAARAVAIQSTGKMFQVLDRMLSEL